MKQTLLLVCTFLQSLIAFTQTSPVYVWWNPAQSDRPVIEGQAWPKQVQHPYDRLPASAEKTVRKEVWNLSRQSAGLLIRFRASTEQVVVRFIVEGKHALPHMPATGVSGVDLYAVNSDGSFLWCAGKYTFGDTIQYHFTQLQANDTYHTKGREYRLYLPLYNSVKWLQIGVPQGASFTPLPVRIDKPIVVYGTSIAQGACASRPGMAWTAIVGRKLDRPLINLGFSGNGRLEKEVIDLLPTIDAKLYVLDCLPNLIATVGIAPQEIKQRILESVKTLRQKQPATPILLVEHAGYTEGLINPERRQLYQGVNALLRQAFAQLKTEAVRQVYLLPLSEINLSLDATVDGTHPSDLGMQQYAEGYEKSIRNILSEPVGAYTTMQPCIQARNADIYDWETRHKEVLTLTKTKAPEIIFLGNSITHFWGGQPQAPMSWGSESWNNVFGSLDMLNLGFGWDRIENVLWRVYHEELDGYTAKQVIIMIGTNNLHLNSDKEIIEGLRWLVQAIQIRQSKAAILLVGILPRRQQEKRVSLLNEGIVQAAGELNITYADPGQVFLNSEGKIQESLFSDGLHPNEEGYGKLAERLRPYLKPDEQRGKRKK